MLYSSFIYIIQVIQHHTNISLAKNFYIEPKRIINESKFHHVSNKQAAKIRPTSIRTFYLDVKAWSSLIC